MINLGADDYAFSEPIQRYNSILSQGVVFYRLMIASSRRVGCRKTLQRKSFSTATTCTSPKEAVNACHHDRHLRRRSRRASSHSLARRNLFFSLLQPRDASGNQRRYQLPTPNFVDHHPSLPSSTPLVLSDNEIMLCLANGRAQVLPPNSYN